MGIINTLQTVINADSKDLSVIPDKSVNLVVTSPPYPMIEMWDDCFRSQNIETTQDYDRMFREMHELLNRVWNECDRVLTDSGFICINIGDAVKNCDGCFKLFANHAEIIKFFLNKNYCMLPEIIWNKPANSPNKFMGSGMLPAGAYVTLEHEYILIFRKGNKRIFKTEHDKTNRQKSAYFWEERNIWFSDIWNVRGTSQKFDKGERKRSGAFPFEIPYRLINMYSVKGDTVLDPFLGTGTTLCAALGAQRNGIGCELSPYLYDAAVQNIQNSKEFLNDVIDKRIQSHNNFISSLPAEKAEKCYLNAYHNFSVKTSQEKLLEINRVNDITTNVNRNITEFNVSYEKEEKNVKGMDFKQCHKQISIEF